MKRIFALLILLATFASAQTDSTDILIIVREDGDTTAVGRWRAGMPVLIRDSWDGWGSREKLPNKFVIIRVGIAKARIDSFLVAHTDSTTRLRRKYQLSRAAIQFVKNNRDANNVVRVTPAQLRNAFKRANRLRRFGEPQRMSIIPDRLYIRWRNMLIGATPTTATVNTDGGGDYTSLAAAEAGEQKDLVTANEQLTINCSGTTADVTAVVFDGWTTDATRNVIIQGDNRTGIWNTDCYRLRTNTISINITGITNLKIDNCQIGLGVGSGSMYGIGVSNTSASTVVISNTILNGGDGTKGVLAAQIYNAAHTVVLQNCIISGFKAAWDSGIMVNSGSTVKAYNCIFYNNSIISRIVSGTFEIKNSAALNSGNFNGLPVGDYNITSGVGMPGANSLNSTIVNFADAANGDFRLLAGSQGIDQGFDLSADPNYAFNTDIIGTVRPQGSAWDIGAFEYVQPATNNDKNSRYKGFGSGFRGGWKK